MKKRMAILLAITVLCIAGCTSPNEDVTGTNPTAETTGGIPVTEPVLKGDVTEIVLSGNTIAVSGAAEDAIYTSNDIIYYEDKDIYESGNPYGEGEAHERHTAEEAASHLVVNITQPGNYRVSGELTLGQIRVDLGENAYEDPGAVVNLVLDGVTINCTVAPAILFRNVYECDGKWSTETASAQVDTAAAGANLILAEGSRNIVNGSHVAKIYKDKEEEKKLWKQDGAVYSYMSMNVYGPGSLDLYADNEGLDTELHLTIQGGNINIRSDNDGINTNEDGVSVTTINGGNLHIIAGLGAEGDGIDSNGYLVINGGTVISCANPASDAGLDSDLGSYINGGTVVALGSAMDWAESDSGQVTMNLQFSQMQSGESAILVAREDGSCVFAYDPGEDEVLGENIRQYMGAVISCANFQVGDSYHIYTGGIVAGTEVNGIYEPATVTGFEGGSQQAYTGTDVMRGPGGMGGFGGGQRPGDSIDGQEPPEKPEGDMPENWTMPSRPEDWTIPEGEMPAMPENWTAPEGGRPEDWTMPEGEEPPGSFGGMDGRGDWQSDGHGVTNTVFYMKDKVNFFSGLAQAQTE